MKTIMCSKLLVSMSGLCASEGGYVATSQADYGTLNHAERIKKKQHFTTALRAKPTPQSCPTFMKTKQTNPFSDSVTSLYIYLTLMILLISLLPNKCLPVCKDLCQMKVRVFS